MATSACRANRSRRHIAYDIGAETVVRRLAALTGAPAALAMFSRLLIDPNRGEDDPTLVMRISDGASFPAMRESARRKSPAGSRPIWRPYRDACAGLIDAALARGPFRPCSEFIPSPRVSRAARGPGRSACCGTAIRASPRR